MVFFDKEAQVLRSRWGAIDVKAVDFAVSPFGLTGDGLQDFRGFVVSGTASERYVLSKRRFEKCDFSFAQFRHSEISNSLFVGCKLYAVDLHSCPVVSTPMPNCYKELVVSYQKPEKSFGWFKDAVSKQASFLPPDNLKICRLDQLQLSDFDNAVVYLLSAKSAPSLEIFNILIKMLAKSDKNTTLIVLNQDDYSACSEEEHHLLILLFGDQPCGLGEMACLLNQKVVASRVLAKTSVREAIVTALAALAIEAKTDPDEMTEERFWEIVSETKPDENSYLPDSQGKRIVAVLRALSDHEFVLFDRYHRSLCAQIYRSDIATAASTIGTGCGDDSFDDFCAALVYRGRQVYYDVVANIEEALLNLNGTHYLLTEGFGSILWKLRGERAASRERLTQEASHSNIFPSGFGGPDIDDDDEACQKLYPRLFEKYWNREEFQLCGTLPTCSDDDI